MTNHFLVCDDVEVPEGMLLENLDDCHFTEFPKGTKIVHGTFGKFNINDFPIKDCDFKKMYQQIPYPREAKLFRYIRRELEYTGEHELVLSITESRRIKAEEFGRTYKNRFYKTYDSYGQFWKEWEEIEK